MSRSNRICAANLTISLALLAGCSSGGDANNGNSIPASDSGAGGTGGAHDGGAGQGGFADGAAGAAGSAGLPDGAAGSVDASPDSNSGPDAACDPVACLLEISPYPPGCAEAVCVSDKCVYRARDKDGDGHANKFCKDSNGKADVEVGKDCDDDDATRNPGQWDGPPGDASQPDRCDGIDQNCSGTADDDVLLDGTSCTCKPGTIAECSETSDGKSITWPAGVPVGACHYGSKTCQEDVNSGGGKWSPCTGAQGPVPETCDGNDNNCNNVPSKQDDETPKNEFVCDADSDDHLATSDAVKVTACDEPQSGCEKGQWIRNPALAQFDDCDDHNPVRFPNNVESCDTIDNDCDSDVDEGVQVTVYQDNDYDGYGTSVSKSQCGPTPGWSMLTGDCQDGQPSVHPGVADVCADGIDNDCDGAADNAAGCGCQMGQVQECGGGQYNAAPAICRRGTQSCQVGGTWSSCSGNVNPVNEACNLVDDNCDGVVNEGFTCNPGQTRTCKPCGAFGGEGVQTCTSACGWGNCVPPADKNCNAFDDDCDGAYDEDYLEGLGDDCRVPVNRYVNNADLYSASSSFLTRSGGPGSGWYAAGLPHFYVYSPAISSLVDLRRCRFGTSNYYSVRHTSCPSDWTDQGSIGYAVDPSTAMLIQALKPTNELVGLYALIKRITIPYPPQTIDFLMYTTSIAEYDQLIADGWKTFNTVFVDIKTKWGVECGFYSNGAMRKDLCGIAGVWTNDV